MDNLSSSNSDLKDFMEESARPQFLSVLCILTWVMSALMFISTLWGAFNQPTPEEQFEQIEKIRERSPEMADRMEAAFESQSDSYKIVNTILTLIALGLTSFGVMLMWQLKKNGFYFYLVGELIPYLGFAMGGTKAIGAMGAMTGMSESAMVGIAIGVMALFDGVFIAMYAANFKHMK